MDAATARRVMRDPAAFRAELLIECNGTLAKLGQVQDDWQRDDFEALDPAWRRIAGQHVAPPPIMRGYLERPRGHSKTADIAAMGSWVLAASPRQLSGFAVAADADQARYILDAISRLQSQNDLLRRALVVQQGRVVNPRTRSTLTLLSSDVSSSW